MSEKSKIFLLLTALVSVIILLVYVIIKADHQPKIKVNLGESKAFVTPKVKIERLTTQVDDGLNKVIIDDTTVLLIYRGIESVSMIKLK